MVIFLFSVIVLVWLFVVTVAGLKGALTGITAGPHPLILMF